MMTIREKMVDAIQFISARMHEASTVESDRMAYNFGVRRDSYENWLQGRKVKASVKAKIETAAKKWLTEQGCIDEDE